MTERTADILIDTENVEQTMAVGAAIGRACVAGDLVALQGELGAGKTQLVRGIAQGMGIDPRYVNSPTFVLMQEYEPVDELDDLPVLVHIDAYRIKSADDLASIGWQGHGEALRDQVVVAVEWAALIEPALGEDVLWAELEHAPHGRRICLSAQGAWRGKMRLLSESLRDAGLNLTEGAEP